MIGPEECRCLLTKKLHWTREERVPTNVRERGKGPGPDMGTQNRVCHKQEEKAMGQSHVFRLLLQAEKSGGAWLVKREAAGSTGHQGSGKIRPSYSLLYLCRRRGEHWSVLKFKKREYRRFLGRWVDVTSWPTPTKVLVFLIEPLFPQIQ